MLSAVSHLQQFAAICSQIVQQIFRFEGKSRCCRTKFLCGSSSSSSKMLQAAPRCYKQQQIVAQCAAVLRLLWRKCAANSVTATSPTPDNTGAGLHCKQWRPAHR